MFRIKTSLVALAAVAACAVEASSASATWFVEGEELSGSAALATTAKVTENGKLAFSETTIECKGADLDGVSLQIESPDRASAASLIFSECSAQEGSNCKLAGASTIIGTLPFAAEVTAEGAAAAAAIFKPKTKTTFATLKLEGASCALAGVEAVTGNAATSLPTGQEESETQAVRANTVSGELKVGTAIATLKGVAEFKLASAQRFAFLPAAKSKLFRWKVSQTGKIVTFTVENIAGKKATVKKIQPFENPAGDWNLKADAYKGCEKAYNAGESCPFEVEYTGNNLALISFVLIDEVNDIAKSRFVCTKETC